MASIIKHFFLQEQDNIFMLSLHGTNITIRVDKKISNRFSLFRKDGK